MAAAMTFHALLLFGFRRPQSRPKIVSPDPIATKVPPVIVDILEPDDMHPASAALPAKGSPDAGRPVTDEPPFRPAPDDFPQAPSIAPFVPIVNRDRIAPGIVGALDGSEEIAGLSGSGPIDFSRLDHAPRIRAQIPPAYPARARSEGRTGEVLVAFVVDEEGRVHDPHVIRSSDAIFEEATLRAISQWRFEPGKVNGRPVRFRMAVPMRFVLDS
jgi:protein TonB